MYRADINLAEFYREKYHKRRYIFNANTFIFIAAHLLLILFQMQKSCYNKRVSKLFMFIYHNLSLITDSFIGFFLYDGQVSVGKVVCRVAVVFNRNGFAIRDKCQREAISGLQ